MNPKRLEDIEAMIDGPDFLDLRQPLREMIDAYRHLLGRYLATQELLGQASAVRDEYRRKLVKVLSENSHFDLTRFQLVRDTDVSGVSGTGVVAVGVEFSDGQCVMRWLTETASTAVYASISDLVKIHGHDGATRVEWIDV